MPTEKRKAAPAGGGAARKRSKSRVPLDQRLAAVKRKTDAARRRLKGEKRKRAEKPSAPKAKPKPGDACPWWKQELIADYAALPREGGGARRATVLRRGDGKGEAKSWFSVKSIPLVASSAGPTPDSAWRARMAFEERDVWSAETGAGHKAATARKGKELAPEPLVQQRVRKIRMRLTRDQERTLKNWMGAVRFTYNRAAKLVREDARWTFAEGQYLNEHVTQAKALGARAPKENATEEEREAFVQKEADKAATRASLGVELGSVLREKPWLADVPSQMRKNAVRDVVKAHKSNVAMREARPHHRWELKYRRRSDPSAWNLCVIVRAVKGAFVEPRPSEKVGRDGRRRMRRGCG